MAGRWEPQPPGVYDEALAYLIADAKRRHKEVHDASPEGCCRLCLDRELRALVRAARAKLSPEDFNGIRWSVQVEMG